ncbi:uncharacterized protein [Clytia hemisphaerica]|uniref:uncharacterized protein n=1 Tax=Clytia hemisphaerica TaxID=252671 RepID=UPI0034D410FE
MKEVKGTIKTLKAVFDKKPAEFNYDELILAERNISANQQSMNNLSKQMEKILLSQHNFPNDEIKTVTTSYDALVVSKSMYVTNLEATLKHQEIAKEQKFQSSKLNIKLSKFKGYDSSSDFYSFKTDFDKLHAKSTPTAHLPDLIKNNYLEGPALTLVKGVDDIDEIWRRLKSSYGDPKLLLSKKLSTLNKATRLWRNRDPEKQIETISSMLNFMRDAMNLSRKHQIENFLFYGKTLEDIYQLMDDARQTKWFSFLEGKTLDQPDVREEIIKFLETELSIQQLKLLHCSQPTSDTGKQTPGNGKQGPSGGGRSSHHTDYKNPIIQTKCFICGATGHIQTNGPNNSKLLQYFSCPEFVQMKPSQRFNTLRQKGYCTQCLFPGAQQSKGKHQEGRCQREFTCPHPSHDNFDVKKHVLVCQDHASTPECHQVLQNFKERCILRQTRLQQFSKDIKLVFHIDTQSYNSRRKTTQPSDVDSTDNDDDNDAIYILQTVIVDGQLFTIFFDSGCSDMVISENAVKRLGERAKVEYSGDIPIGGVGNVQTYSSGSYKVNIPLHNGHDAQLKGLCLPKITSTFPTYELKQVEEDIISAFQKTGGNPDDLPSLPSSVGGEVDIMLGIKYHRYHPKEVFQLTTGLTIFQSLFNNSDGSRGVVGGPHRAFNIINQHHIAVNQMNTFLATHRKLSSHQLTTLPEVDLIHVKVEKDHQQNLMLEFDDQHPTALVTRNSKVFEEAENAGSQITYRCVHCRDCKECKISESIESISLKEEVEQHLINQSVSVELKNRISHASLPLLHNPETKLVNNKHKALKVYFQQLRKLDKEPSDKKDVIASEAKLQSMGYVDYVENLTPQQQQMLSNTKVVNFIPWRAVWKPNSLSTPCRIVFDASQPTDSGYSLNDILAKGTNNMNRLVEILIRWSLHHTAFHTDIRKMYNSVRLREHHWCLQRYIWEEQLDKTKIPKEKVIKTLIYGVKSSGNQSERALRETGRLSSEDYPEVAKIVMKDIYVDDCLSGEKSMELATQRTDELEIVVNRGGFSLKGITFSHQKPKPDLTSDGESIGVAGMK